MQDTAAPAAALNKFRHEYETFTWARWTWDIAKLQRDIDSGHLRLHRDTRHAEFIGTYATQVLGLRKELGRAQRPFSIWITVNVEAAYALPLVALDEPVLLLCPPKGTGLLSLKGHTSPDHVLADGNHRLARAFLEGRETLDCYVLSTAQSRKYRIE